MSTTPTPPPGQPQSFVPPEEMSAQTGESTEEPSSGAVSVPPHNKRTAVTIGVLAVLVVALAAALVAALNRKAVTDPAPAAAPSAIQAAPQIPTPVTVAAVHDAATIVLADGTRLRQVGISAPAPDTCQAKQATATTDAEVRRGVLTYQLLGQADVYGNQWAYLRVGTVDLGEKLASLGWVWAYPDSPAPQGYNQRITNAVEAARTARTGAFGTACPGAPVPAQPAPPPGRTTIENGTWIVGSDIQPGTYRTAGPSTDGPIRMMCVWKRMKDTTGEIGSTLAINVTQGPTTVTIKPTDGAFDSQNCQPWTRIN